MTERERERQAAIYEREFAKQEEQIKALERKIYYRRGYADGKRDAMKWISVKDRLPEDVRDYLVVTDESTVYIAVFTGARWYRTLDAEFIRDGEVTHWMPLPPLPEGGQDD